MNMVLSDVEETVYLVDIDQQTQQNVVRVKANISLLGFPRETVQLNSFHSDEI